MSKKPTSYRIFTVILVGHQRLWDCSFLLSIILSRSALNFIFLHIVLLYAVQFAQFLAKRKHTYITVLEGDLLFPDTAVPAQETSYFCQLFDLPSDKPYHLLATEPILNNTHVIHHITLFGCSIKGIFKC